MATASSIEWTDATWNPVTGCTKVSQGCKHCYAERMAKRLQAMGVARYADGFKLALQEDQLDAPLRWRKPKRVFVNSMSDLFHKDVPTEFIRRVFEVMEQCPQHEFQVLTKRADRLEGIAPELVWPRNVWMGVSVEDRPSLWRMGHLRHVPAAVRFLSVEPLLERLGPLDLRGIDWVIVGGESGPGARPMQADWVREIRASCRQAEVAFFFKQWGGVVKKKTGRELDGQFWDEMPAAK